jgi:hypothetical protein
MSARKIMKLKKYLSLFLMLSVAFVFAVGTAQAQTTDNSNSAETNTDTSFGMSTVPTIVDGNIRTGVVLQVNLPDVKAKDSVGGASNTETSADNADVGTQIINKITARFSKLADDLSGIADRIAARAEIMKKSGIDVSAEEDLVVKAKANIVSAQGFITDIKNKATNGATVADIKESITSTKDALKEAHGYLEDAVTNLKVKITANRKIN